LAISRAWQQPWCVACSAPRLPRARMLCSESTYHVPVLRDETVEWLITDPAGTYCDGTLGGGGHSLALLKVLEKGGGHLIGTDRDTDALCSAGSRLATYISTGHATLIRSNFGALPEALGRFAGASSDGTGWLDGLLLDLGVSSHQLDDAGRGFSFMRDGPLDMRMDQSSPAGKGIGAEPLVNDWSAAAIADMLWQYGDLRESRPLARAIVAARPVTGTAHLASVLSDAVRGAPKDKTKRVARAFQALRIEVNGEMRELETALNAATKLIKPGGRLAIMSYHSLEDRRVKRFLRTGSFDQDSPTTDAYGNVLAPWKTLTRQPVLASDDEIAVNSRARSVRLRVGERTSFPP